MATTTNISAKDMLSSYALFNATDIKQFIIDQLRANNSAFKDVEYLGSNINAFIDIIAVMLQQILFSYSVNASETAFSTATLYESMSKLVSILNYKAAGKQTSILPVKITINRPAGYEDVKQIVLPKFLTANYNYQYVLPAAEVVDLTSNITTIDTVLFQGVVQEHGPYIAVGDEFEIITLTDDNIKNSASFISDNFFTVYVDEKGDGDWKEYQECANLFFENSIAEKYEKRFTEDFNYEFKFGNGTHGKKLTAGARIIIYYLVSNGEVGTVGSNTVSTSKITSYNSSSFSNIKDALDIKNITSVPLSWLTLRNSGPSTAITYPESVESIRKNAPKVFSSHNRMFSLEDYKTYIIKNFTAYIADLYMADNNFYTKNYLKYFYDLGLAAPQKDSRVALAQVEFMNSTNFNNIYCFLVPSIVTLIDGKVPNYLNTSLKKQIVNKCKSQMGPTHNLVIVDPIYKAFTFGSYKLDDTDWNAAQLANKLVIVKNKHSKYSSNYIKNYCVENLRNYFMQLKIGSKIDTAIISQLILETPGIVSFFIYDANGNKDSKISLYSWNPLYKNEDNTVSSQAINCKEFEYPYFYDLQNLDKLVMVVEES
jgi:hypothetical protein